MQQLSFKGAGDKSSGAKNIFLTKGVTLSIEGWNPPVSMVSIDIQEGGGIPSATVIVDPAHTNGAPGVPASAPSLGTIKAWLDRAQKLAGDPKSRATLSVALEDGEGGSQAVSLKNWIITAAGMSDVGPTGRLGIEITLQHPVGLLDRSVASIGNVKTAKIVWGSDNYQNPIQGLAEVLKTWAKLPRVAPTQITNDCAGGKGKGSSAAMISAMQAKLAEKAEEINKHLKWQPEWAANAPGYSDWPFAKSCFSGEINSVKAALTSYAGDFGESSIWSLITGVMLPDWQLTVVPTYYADQLLVMPMSPWAAPVIAVYDDEISSISFPGIDAAPVGGIRIPFTPAQGGLQFSYYQASQGHESQQLSGEVLYVPYETEVAGRVITHSAPSWLMATARVTAARAGSKTEAGKAEGLAMLETGENIDPYAAMKAGAGTEGLNPASSYAGALYGVAKQFFLSQCRAETEATVITKLMFTTPTSKAQGGYLVPGCVVQIRTRKPEKVLFEMYLKRVNHIYDAGKSTALTALAGSFCRPEDGIPGIISPSTYNPMYL